MHFDSYELSIHVNIADTGSNAELFQLVNLAGAYRTSEVSKIDS